METEQKPPVDYEVVLADLEAKRDELDNAIAVIKRMLGQPSYSVSQAQKPHNSDKLTPTSFFGLGISEAATNSLSHAKYTSSAPDLATSTTAHRINALSMIFTA